MVTSKRNLNAIIGNQIIYVLEQSQSPLFYVLPFIVLHLLKLETFASPALRQLDRNKTEY